MKLLKKITILLCFLSLIAFVSCSAEDKTGVKNNPPENDTEIKGDSGSGGGEPETIETIEIEAKDFPTDLLGTYRDDRVYPGYKENGDTKVEHDKLIKKIKIEGVWHKDDAPGRGSTLKFTIEKWKKTTKGGETIKLEVEVDEKRGKGIITFDCKTKTLSGKFTWSSDGVKNSFNGKKIS